MVSGASVAAEIVEQGRGPKVIAFKKRRRKNSRRKRGHRQEFTLIRISEILTGGAKPSKGPKPKPEREGQAGRRRRRRDDEAEGAKEGRARPKAKDSKETAEVPQGADNCADGASQRSDHQYL